MTTRAIRLTTPLLLALLITLPLAARSAVGSPPIASIAPWVTAHTTGGASAEVLIILRTQADLAPAQRLPGKAAKAQFVRDTLWQTAQTTQAPLIAWLAARGVAYRSYYLVNMLWLTADAATLQQIAARPEVDRIVGNPVVRGITDPPAPAAAPDAAPAAIEPGISYVHAPDVWSLGFNGQGIVIAGADTGYFWTHPALKSHYRGWNGTTADHNYSWHDSIHTSSSSCGANSAAPCDDYGHGTHTMGTMVGDDGATNQVGMAPGAKWIGCRNMDGGNGTPATYIECFEFFLAPYPVGGTTAQGDPSKAPDVTNNSWGCPPSEGCDVATFNTALAAQRAAGIMTVVSAGNSGSSC